jgi:hypothetical protein
MNNFLEVFGTLIWRFFLIMGVGITGIIFNLIPILSITDPTGKIGTQPILIVICVIVVLLGDVGAVGQVVYQIRNPPPDSTELFGEVIWAIFLAFGFGMVMLVFNLALPILLIYSEKCVAGYVFALLLSPPILGLDIKCIREIIESFEKV